MNTGSKKIFSKNKLLTTICYRLNGKNTYALEGSIFIAGAGVQWLRDKIKIINNAHEIEKIVKSKKTDSDSNENFDSNNAITNEQHNCNRATQP